MVLAAVISYIQNFPGAEIVFPLTRKMPLKLPV
jgi:hypothetical protein